MVRFGADWRPTGKWRSVAQIFPFIVRTDVIWYLYELTFRICGEVARWNRNAIPRSMN